MVRNSRQAHGPTKRVSFSLEIKSVLLCTLHTRITVKVCNTVDLTATRYSVTLTHCSRTVNVVLHTTSYEFYQLGYLSEAFKVLSCYLLQLASPISSVGEQALPLACFTNSSIMINHIQRNICLTSRFTPKIKHCISFSPGEKDLGCFRYTLSGLPSIYARALIVQLCFLTSIYELNLLL